MKAKGAAAAASFGGEIGPALGAAAARPALNESSVLRSRLKSAGCCCCSIEKVSRGGRACPPRSPPPPATATGQPPGGSGSGIGITGIRFAAPPPPSAAGGATGWRLWRVRASEADRGDATGLATARLGTATDRGSSSETLLPSSSADRGRDAGRDVLPTDELADGGVAVRDTGVDGVDGSGGDLPPLASGLAPEAVRRRDGMSSAVRVTANAGRPAGACDRHLQPAASA